MLPFAFLYGFAVALRNQLYLRGIIKRNTGPLPTVVVGNIRVGGTGKTPFVIWLASQISADHPAVLSRGYGRKSKGFLEVFKDTDPAIGGDEPVFIQQMTNAFSKTFVCEDRIHGLNQIFTEYPETDIVILDDGFQHLRLKANVYILLTRYDKPDFRDFPFPSGRLREFRNGVERADAVVVTKCPDNLGIDEALQISEHYAKYGKPIYFASYGSPGFRDVKGMEPGPGNKYLVISGLADNDNFVSGIRNQYQIAEVFGYSDHHDYSENDMAEWNRSMKDNGAAGILTTGKDWVKISRLKPDIPVFSGYNVPEILFDGEDDLIGLILRKIE